MKLKLLATATCLLFAVSGVYTHPTFAKSALLKTFKGASSARTVARAATTAKALRPNTLNSLSRPKPVTPKLPQATIPKIQTATPNLPPVRKLEKQKLTPPSKTRKSMTPQKRIETKPSQSVRQSLQKISENSNGANRSKLAASAGKLSPGKLRDEAHAAIRKIDQNTAAKIAVDKKRLSNKTLGRQAEDLIKLNNGSNRVVLRSPSAKIEVDLAGRAHGGIETPHTKISPRNMKANKRYQPAYNTGSKKAVVRSSTQGDIRLVRKYLDKKNKR